MGTSDIGRLDGLTAGEKFAAVVVERATGARAAAHDVGGKQGAYDVHLTYPDGRCGALEVTTHAGPGVQQMEALLGGEDWTWPNPGEWWWTASVDDVRELPRLRAAYGHVILLCEAAGVDRPSGLPRAVREADPDVRWLVHESSCRLTGHPTVPARPGDGRERGVMVTPSGAGAMVDRRLTGLPAAVTALLAVDHIARRAAKVCRAATDERHLFVGIGNGGLPDPLYIALVGVMPGALPVEAPTAPDGLTHLWLTTGWRGSPLLEWSRAAGWAAWPLGDDE